MTPGNAGDKRKAMEPADVFSVEDVAMWLEAQIDDGSCGKIGLDVKERILLAVRENEVRLLRALFVVLVLISAVTIPAHHTSYTNVCRWIARCWRR